MDKIFIRLRDVLARLFAAAPADPVSLMGPRELADLPSCHPRA